MKYISVILVLLISFSVSAGGWSSEAKVQNVEIIRNQGFQITGLFGNPSECINGNSIFVALDHPQYEELLSIALAAFMGDKKLKVYSHKCVSYGWHGGDHNELTAAGSMYIIK